MPHIKYLLCMEKGYKGNRTNFFGPGELMEIGDATREKILPEMKVKIARITKDTPISMVYTFGTTGVLKMGMLSLEDR